MRIKMSKKATVIGFTHTVPKHAVIESDDPAHEAEYKALVAAGLAKKTNEAVSDPNTFASVGGNTPNISGIVKAPAEGEGDEYDVILAGTIPEVTEALAGKDEAFLNALAERESAGEGRVGVGKAIDSALAALKPAE